MIRRYFLFGLITLLFSVSVYAQYEQTGGFARLRGIGNNPYVVDPYFMTVNPAWGGHYQNFLFGDLGSQTTPWGSGGVGQFIATNFHLGRGFSLGAMLTRNDFNGFSIGSLDPFSAAGPGAGVISSVNFIIPDAVIPMNNNLELMGSIKSGNSAFGLGIAYASTNNEFAPDTGAGAIGSASQLGFNAGVVAELSGSFMIDLGASLMLPSATFEPPAGNNTEASQTIILVNARAFWQYSSRLAFVPSVAFMTASGTVDNGTTATTTTTDLISFTFIAAGFGFNYQVGDFLLAGGPGFASVSATQSSTETSPELTISAFVFPVWNLGVEWDLADWLVGRFGYVAANASVTIEEPASVNTVNEFIMTQYFPLGATVGVGFMLGNFTLDATVNEDVLRQGLNNLGGNGPGANTFAYLSLSYAMP
jgi:hypothetical protein